MSNVQCLFSILKRISFIYENNSLFNMRRMHAIIHGTVQGVFFRDTTKRIASGLGLKGYVRNMDDGCVEVVAEGLHNKLSELIHFCSKGPEGDKVSKINIKIEKPTNEFHGFEVKH
jgi:acylphosphatase